MICILVCIYRGCFFKYHMISYDILFYYDMHMYSKALMHLCKLILHKHKVGFYPSMRARRTGWTSDSFENGEIDMIF